MTVSGCADPLPFHLWHAGPLALHITGFAGRLAEQGYAPFTTQEKLRLVTRLSQWLQQQYVGADALNPTASFNSLSNVLGLNDVVTA